MKKSKRLGRPGRTRHPGERIALAFRVSFETKKALELAAEKNGRSQSQEAEYRIQKSFSDDDLVHRIFNTMGRPSP